MFVNSSRHLEFNLGRSLLYPWLWIVYGLVLSFVFPCVKTPIWKLNTIIIIIIFAAILYVFGNGNWNYIDSICFEQFSHELRIFWSYIFRSNIKLVEGNNFLFARDRELRLKFQLGCFNCFESHLTYTDELSALK